MKESARAGRGAVRRNKGFTLIELIIVLAVLGVLAAIVVPNVSGFLEQGKQRAFDSDEKILQASVDAWRTDFANRAGNSWPTVGGVTGTPSIGSGGSGVFGSGTGGINSIINIASLNTGNFIRGTDAVKSFRYGTVTGAAGATNSPIGSYYWFVNSTGEVTGWYDANSNNAVDSGETGYQTGMYP